MSADLGTLIWTTIVVVVLLLGPGVVLAWYALDEWIADDKSYASVIASIKKR